jgi:hypothetical protein
LKYIVYTSFTDSALAEAVEVMEEFLDADLPLKDFGLHTLFNVKFNVNHILRLDDAESTKIG